MHTSCDSESSAGRYLCPRCRPGKQGPEARAPHQGLQGRKECSLHADDRAQPLLQHPAIDSRCHRKENHFRVTQRDPSPEGRRPVTAPALDSAFARAPGARASRARRGALSGENELICSRATEPGLGVESGDARGRDAWSMRMQAASSERKRARIPSGKAGAERGWEGGPHSEGRAGGRVLASGLIAISPCPCAARIVVPALNTWQRGGRAEK